MKEKKRSKLTLVQNFSLILRGLRILNAFPKPVMLSKTVSCVFNAAVPFISIYFSAQILNELAGAKNKHKLIILVLTAIGVNLASMIMKSVIGRWAAYCSTTIWISMHEVFANKALSMDYIDIENPAVQQEYSEIRQHQNGMSFGLPRLTWAYDGIITGFIQVVLSIAMAFSMFLLKVPVDSPFMVLDSPLSVGAVAAALLCSILLAPYLFTTGGKIWTKASSDNNKSNRFFFYYFFEMIDDYNKAKDIRIYDQKRLIYTGLKNFMDMSSYIRATNYNAMYSALSTAVSHLSNGLIYLYIALKAYAGAFGVGNIVQYMGAVSQFGGGFASILTNIGALINNNTFLDKALKFLDIPNKKYMGTLSVEKRDDNEYEIEFHDVSFKYPGSDSYALKNLDMKLHVGRRIAVVGMNGSGKTTMIKLLCRLYDPTEGCITLNGIDIRKYNYDEYMAIFSIVFQDFMLLPFTLGQNVAASVQYDESRVLASLDKSGLSARLDNMPQGDGTYLYKNFEEDGVEISGGEAQKIALARALYKDAPFIVLDEPTAALDPVAEYEVYTKFNDIVGDKTAIYISHRLSSCRFCNDIAVFHEGRLIQRGSHDTLVSDKSGKYCELWNAQAQYYAETVPEQAGL